MNIYHIPYTMYSVYYIHDIYHPKYLRQDIRVCVQCKRWCMSIGCKSLAAGRQPSFDIRTITITISITTIPITITINVSPALIHITTITITISIKTINFTPALIYNNNNQCHPSFDIRTITVTITTTTITISTNVTPALI